MRTNFSLEGLLQLAVLVASLVGGAYVMSYRLDQVEKQHAELLRLAQQVDRRSSRVEAAVNYLGQTLYEKKILRLPPRELDNPDPDPPDTTDPKKDQDRP